MNAHMHDAAIALLGLFVASALPLSSLAAALRSRTVAYWAARATSPV
jgi:hypothetical protein